MIKTLDVLTESIRSSRTPFRKVESLPAKCQKHRYERRKIREYIRLGDWTSQ
jgi:hypothetical protein